MSKFIVKPTGEAGSLFGVCADFGWEPLHAAAAGDKQTIAASVALRGVVSFHCL